MRAYGDLADAFSDVPFDDWVPMSKATCQTIVVPLLGDGAPATELRSNTLHRRENSVEDTGLQLLSPTQWLG
eukprot:3807659-Prymnesium_polylepis.1